MMDNNQIYEAFDHVKMDDSCAARVRAAMGEHRAAPMRHVWKAAAALACLMLAVTLCNPTVAQAIEEVVEEIKVQITGHYEFEDGNVIIDQGITEEGFSYSSGAYNTGSTPSWLEDVDGRLYFVTNGVRIDITDLISYDEPFTYVYTDANRITHYIAVGGCYDPEKGIHDSLGWNEWYRDQAAVDAAAARGEDTYDVGWLGGYGKGFGDGEGEKNAWSEKAPGILGIPWG